MQWGVVNESYHSLAKWSRVCLKLAGLFAGGILLMSIQSLALKRWASGLSPRRPLKIGGGIFSLQVGMVLDLLGLGLVIPTAAACMAVTICANKAASAGRGPGGPAGSTGPARHLGSGRGGDSGGGGAGPPAGLPPLPPGGTGAAISNAQCNNKLNLTLLVIN